MKHFSSTDPVEKKPSLVVVGSGIKFMSHFTLEAKAYIQQSDKVLYLVNEPATKEWIKKVNPSAESLDEIYHQHQWRIDAYRAITAYILKTLQQHKNLCVVIYGHPSVLAKPTLDAVIQAKEAGYDAKMLPAVSAEDCLFADLLIDPGTCGCFSFDATDFLVYKRLFDPCSHLILWQVGFIGKMDQSSSSQDRAVMDVLVNYLKDKYPLEHEVILYEAAQYPHFEPHVNRVKLGELPAAELSPITTLYVPPARKAVRDSEMLESLGITC